MKIGVIAPPWLPVPPPGYGGTEFIIDLLATGLRDRGHDVTLFTTGDAECDVQRAWLYPKSLGTAHTSDEEAERGHLIRAYQELSDADVIHDHSLLGPGLQRCGQPVVTTMHGPMDDETRAICRRYRDNVSVVAISASQRDSAPDVRFASVIHHGIRVEDHPMGAGEGGYFLCLARMNPDKGIHAAIDIARRAGRPLVIAAKMQEPAERDYYEQVIEPELGGDIEYLGEAGFEEKLELLRKSTALLNPIEWCEPFGLVMIESLAAGTPVIATTWGSAPEIVEHGRTGFICQNPDEAVAACDRVEELSRAACRQSVVDRFTDKRMVLGYESLFERLARDRADRPSGAVQESDPRSRQVPEPT